MDTPWDCNYGRTWRLVPLGTLDIKFCFSIIERFLHLFLTGRSVFDYMTVLEILQGFRYNLVPKNSFFSKVLVILLILSNNH